jgi:cytochrome c oxidase subunit 2
MIAASIWARHVDGTWRIANLLAAVGVIVFLAALTRMLTRRAPSRPLSARATVAIGALPLVAAIVLFVIGFRGYVDAAVPPADAVEIVGVVRKWEWSFEYPGGFKNDALRVPRGRPVQLTLRSADAPHRFAAPELRLEAEVSPGQPAALWFNPTRSGRWPLACGDACAGGHESMAGAIEVIDENEFNDWIDETGGGKLTPAALGAKLYVRSTCNTCHSTDGKPGVGPSFQRLFGRTETLADGTQIKVDEAYIRESILDPTAKVVRGFQPVMPPFKGQLDDKKVEALIAFIKEVKP